MAAMIFSSCDLFNHLQHMDPPVISGSRPEEGDKDLSDLSSLEIYFSTPMDKVRTEQAFSLQEEGEQVDGSFLWDEKTLSFTPHNGFPDNRDYLVTLKTQAEDCWGNSLEKEWYLNFSTREDRESPALISISPDDFTLLEGTRTALSLSFSEPLDRTSFREGFTISPDILCAESWNAEGTTITLTPLEDYEEDREYRVSLSTGILDTSGNPLLREEEFLFYTRLGSKPEVSSLSIPGIPGELQRKDQGVNSGLERDPTLLGVFDRSLSKDERDSFLRILPAVEYDAAWNDLFNQCFITFPESLSYGEYYELYLQDECYILLVDGEGSVPLHVTRAVFCPDAAAGSLVMNSLTLNGALGASDSDTAFFDIYISHSDLSQIDRMSFINAFSLESSVLSWDYRSLQVWDGSQSPIPDPPPQSHESVVRIHVGVEWTGLGGTVTLKMAEALTDTLGNTQREPWILTVGQL